MPAAHPRQILADHLRHPPAEAAAAPTYIVISIKPSYADLIAAGQKRVEFRRRFPSDFRTGQAIFYVTTPVRAIALIARIVEVRRASPAKLWQEFAATGGATRVAFDTYFAGVRTGAALVLDNLQILPTPIPLDDPRLRAAGFKPPQSLALLAPDSTLPDLIARQSQIPDKQSHCPTHGSR